MTNPLHIVLRCAEAVVPKVRYVFDTLFCACGVPVAYVDQPPSEGPWLLYGDSAEDPSARHRCIALPHDGAAWEFFRGDDDIRSTDKSDGLVIVVPPCRHFDQTWDVRCDLIANAFYFLSSWSERSGVRASASRGLHKDSVFKRFGVPQDVVDRYLERVLSLLTALYARLGCATRISPRWPEGARYAVVLTHDVDFLPAGWSDIGTQGAKTVLRHLVRQQDPADALRAAVGLGRALLRGRDPYGCIPEIIEREKRLGVRSSFQVAVGHHHPNDVNYYVENERTRDYLGCILSEGFELCLHGSYCSTDHPERYRAEVERLARLLTRPIGSRQHFLAFNYDALFSAQERSGIQYDMSMGFPDRVGPRAGFSYPYFPYCLAEDRPYRVLQISLFLMDVTLRGYMRLKGEDAWNVITSEIGKLRRKGGCASVVWHPIVFGGARDPGYDELFWRLVNEIVRTNGAATDGRTINALWRTYAADYPSFPW